MKYSEKILPNGIRVMAVHYPGTKLVSSNVIVRTGGRNEIKEQYGISHFLEHVTFKGSKSFPKPGEATEIIENLGGIVNAWTSEQATCYWNILPEEHLEIALKVLSEQVSALNFDPKEIDKERGPVLEEIKRAHDDPYGFVWHNIYSKMWPGQAIGNGVLGPSEVIERLTADDFRAYMTQNYGGKNMQVTICGSLPPQQVFALVEQYFSVVKQGTKVTPAPINNEQKDSQVSLVHRNIKQGHILFGYKTFGINDPRVPALEVLMNILGTGMSSILFKEIREKRSAAYAVQGESDYFTDAGAIMLYAGLNTDKTEEVIGLIKDILRDLCEKPLKAARVQKAKDFIEGITLYRLDGVERTAYWYTTKGLMDRDNLDPEAYLKKLSAVTPEQIQAVAQDVFKPENETLLVLGPFTDKEKFAKILTR